MNEYRNQPPAKEYSNRAQKFLAQSKRFKTIEEAIQYAQKVDDINEKNIEARRVENIFLTNMLMESGSIQKPKSGNI